MKVSLLTKWFAVFIQTIVAFTCNSHTEGDLSEEQWIEKAISIIIEDNDIPAISVGIVKNSELQLLVSRGYLSRDSSSEVNGNTNFQIGSLTKTFTGILAKVFIAEGRLKLTDSISTYLPHSLSPSARAKLRPITVGDIVFHQSGLPRDSIIAHRFGNEPMLCCYDEQDLLNDLEILELMYKPGLKAEYSNLGYSVLGYIMQRLSGKEFESLLNQYIFKPFEMKNSTTELTDIQQKQAAIPYRKENRKYKTRPFEMGFLKPSGGVFSNVNDLSKLMILQMNAARQEIKQADSNHLWSTEFTRSFSKKWEYGFGAFKSDSGRIMHGGDLDGFASAYSYYPEQDFGLIILTSSGGRWLWQLENLLLQKLMGQKVSLPEFTQSITISKDKLAAYTGRIDIDGKIINIVQRQNSLEAFFSDSLVPYELTFLSSSKAYSKTYGFVFHYTFDENGVPLDIRFEAP
ncbi:serine hydrolase domain-containing protein [Ningiella sp. W23]|uniref:serine hydrolase domain-containing protein n=1 Tax=Ningiella sp. W23 TaxID=3023715 RepID=UPI00375701E3